MFEREPNAGEVLTDAALGALAGAPATAVMAPLTTYLSKHEPEAAKRKEQEVSRRFGGVENHEEQRIADIRISPNRNNVTIGFLIDDKRKRRSLMRANDHHSKNYNER